MGNGKWGRVGETLQNLQHLAPPAIAGNATAARANARTLGNQAGTGRAVLWHMPKSRDIRVRSFEFAVDIVRFCRDIGTRDLVLRRLAWQLVDAAGSVGANLAEAADAQSKADFIAKNCIALKEAQESRFWLRLLASSEPAIADRTSALLAESCELISMLVSIVKTARSNPHRGV